MKRLFSVFSASILLLSSAPALVHAGDCYVDPVIQYSGSGKVKSAVFMRDQACITGSKVIATLSTGASVAVIGFTDGWYRVESNGARGWVGQQFIENGAGQTGTTWSSYEEYMGLYPSRGPSATPAPVPSPSPTPAGETLYLGTVEARNLVKLVCPSVAGVDHACRAVYYIGADGKRHAFPNSRVFFTWYANFDAVRVLSSERLSQYMLGANVTYRPGIRMVKFATDPKVYVVARGGVLRWIKTEELAIALYGQKWNTKVDDIVDSFYSNYTFGSEITSDTEYDPVVESATSATFD